MAGAGAPAAAHPEADRLRPAVHDAAQGEMLAVLRPLDAFHRLIEEFHVSCRSGSDIRGARQVDGPPIAAGAERPRRRGGLARLRRVVLHRAGEPVTAQLDAEGAAKGDGEQVAGARIGHLALPNADRRDGNVPEEGIFVHRHVVPDPAQDGPGALARITATAEGLLQVRRNVLEEPALVG